MKAVYDLPEPHSRVLSLLVARMPPAQFLWALTGSAGLRLQGVDLSVNDLDVQTDAKTFYLIEKTFAGFIKLPGHVWETEHTFSYHAQAEIYGLQVEFLGDVRHRDGPISWDEPLDLRSELVRVEWRGYVVPVLSLAHEAVAYEKMGRAQKAALIHAALQRGSI
jgi:hypothetical protein